ncbi:MAG: glucokinase [unclassified Hahellaceae]|nr:glucokinase [Hahellaceae bacterium]|tara:strand:- start:216 stop:1262 length:1047 start_codon:yes stop_codon:yes gene_type:complete
MNSYALVGDIGGTNARFALIDQKLDQQADAPQAGSNLLAVATLPCADYDNIDEAIRSYLKDQSLDGVAQASLAFACPVNKPDIVMTNNHWRFNKQAMRSAMGFERFAIVNDFTAMALGVSVVRELGGDLLREVGTVDETAVSQSAPQLVIGPGTGLGVSALINVNDEWLPLATEGGHTSFAPTTDHEVAMLKILLKKYGRVSIERLVSGSGLLNIYECHAELAGEPARYHSPADVTAAALGADRTPNALALAALNHFCELLGRVAGDAVLTIGAFGGVHICGGIVPRMIDFFLASQFRTAFEDKGRMAHLLKATPTYVVMDGLAGLRGAAAALSNPFIRSGSQVQPGL